MCVCRKKERGSERDVYVYKYIYIYNIYNIYMRVCVCVCVSILGINVTTHPFYHFLEYSLTARVYRSRNRNSESKTR